MKNGVLLISMVALMVSSALGVIYVKHQSRVNFVEYQRLLSERDRLDVEWGRLQIEQSTWATHGRVERISREKLGMDVPDPSFVFVERD